VRVVGPNIPILESLRDDYMANGTWGGRGWGLHNGPFVLSEEYNELVVLGCQVSAQLVITVHRSQQRRPGHQHLRLHLQRGPRPRQGVPGAGEEAEPPLPEVLRSRLLPGAGPRRPVGVQRAAATAISHRRRDHAQFGVHLRGRLVPAAVQLFQQAVLGDPGDPGMGDRVRRAALQVQPARRERNVPHGPGQHRNLMPQQL